jgi:hypothetical protein
MHYILRNVLFTGERISRFLSNQDSGSYKDLTTPILDDYEDRADLIDDWLAISSILERNLVADCIKKLERQEANKLGPSSIRLPFELREADLLNYFYHIDITPNEAALDYASLILMRLLPLFNLRPISLSRAAEKSDKTTQWGLPWWMKGSEIQEETIALAAEILEKEECSIPCVLGWRGQFSGFWISKQRILWLFPHCISLIEKTFFDVLLPLFQSKSEFCMLLSHEAATVVITRLLILADKNGTRCIGIDFKGFDASIQRLLINIVFQAIANWFQKNQYTKVMFLCDYFATCSILTPRGIYTGRNGSVPSGSGLTNLVDSLVQYLLFHYVTYGLDPDPDAGCTLMGDDGVWYHRELTLDRVVRKVKELGIICNPDKVYHEYRSVSFCQNIYSLEHMSSGLANGIRSTVRCLNGMSSYEYPVRTVTLEEYNSYNAIRWIMQLENCKHHPHFEELVIFAMERCPIGLGTKLPYGLFSLFKGNSFAKTSAFFKDRWRFTSLVRENAKYENLRVVRVLAQQLFLLTGAPTRESD